MLITTKDNLKGELYISAIGHTLRAGRSVTIDDSYASDPDILWAVSKGLIDVEVENLSSDAVSIGDDDYINIKNISNSLLNLSFINKTLEPGHSFALSHDDFNSSEVSMMIEKGWIEIVVSEPKNDIKKISKKTTSKKKKTTSKKKATKKVELDNENIDELESNKNKEKPSINENNSSGMDTVTISFPEVDDDGIIFVDNNNEVG
ncbi:hypothetical protein CMI47_23510 [Candidatus Pacearchaeota archaeon]|jgi:hypothetical protein|nr:hypothetical protein [Candidatus Pacearchaeota archaeon]|tara:strand:+ start:2803 stop:3417 length:615 start_codon:yes stop_codon:yes gene_type:complete